MSSLHFDEIMKIGIQLRMLIITTLVWMISTVAVADSMTEEQVMQHHVDAIKAYDVDAIMLDYADDAVAITQNGVYIGKDNIRKLMESLAPIREHLAKLDNTPEFLDKGVVLEHYISNRGTPDESRGKDLFVVRDGKIVFQAVPPTPPADIKVSTPLEVMQHHIDAIRKGDYEELMVDYADNAVAVSPGGVFVGKAEIAGFMKDVSKMSEMFTDMIIEHEERGENVIVQKAIIRPGKPDEFSGSEVFTIENGKIVFQTVVP